MATTLATSSLVDILRKPFRRKSVPNSSGGGGGGGGGGNLSAESNSTNHNNHGAVTTITASSGVGPAGDGHNIHYRSDSLDGGGGGNDGSVVVDMRPIVTPAPYQTFAADNGSANNSFAPAGVVVSLY